MKAQQSRNNHATMKKTKKITNLHDYSKEVDKIIATGKPMVEQFMDLIGLMDVTFIDENQTSNGRLHQLTKSDSSIKRPKKQDSSVQDKQTTEKSSAVENKEKSDCCGAKVLSVQGYPKDEGTHYWQCSKCGAPCNIKSQGGGRKVRSNPTETPSNKGVLPTAEVHLLDWEKEFELWCTQLLGKILKHNKDPMTGLYDYDGIAEAVIDLVKK